MVHTTSEMDEVESTIAEGQGVATQGKGVGLAPPLELIESARRKHADAIIETTTGCKEVPSINS
jgi:hypothetical protein